MEKTHYFRGENHIKVWINDDQYHFPLIYFFLSCQTAYFKETPTGSHPCFFSRTKAMEESIPPDKPTTICLF